MKGPCVVIIDPHWEIRERLRRVYERRGYVAWTCPEPSLALSIFITVLPDLVLMDYEESSEEAHAVVSACRSVCPQTRIIFRPTPPAPSKAA